MAYIPKVTVVNTVEKPTAAQDKILNGVNFLCDAVKQTLGPHGKNFLLEKGIKITNDGISIAKEIQLKDEVEDLAVRIAREAAVKTNDEAGDGTTTTLTLLQAILKEAVRLLPGKKLIGKKSVIQIRKQIHEECALVIEKLRALAKPVESKEALIEVARVAVEDKDLATLIGSAQWELGPGGTLIPEEHLNPEDAFERIPGIRTDNGLGATQVINNHEKDRLEVKDVPVIMTNHTLKTLAPIKALLEALVKNGSRKFVIVARAYTQLAIRQCQENLQSGIEIFPINAPYVHQREIMKDMEAVLGGRYIDEEEGELEDMNVSDVGFAKQVIAARYSAYFTGVEDEKSKERIAIRVEKLKKELQGDQSIFMKRSFEQRISQLTSGFGIIKVGAKSETDRKYKFDKVEDAANAVKSALVEGTVPGAGLAFKIISDEMPEDSILKRPLLAPYQQIMSNAGDDFVIEPWVRNSLKVERVALEYACQVAADLATTCGAVTSERKKPRYVEEVSNNEEGTE